MQIILIIVLFKLLGHKKTCESEKLIANIGRHVLKTEKHIHSLFIFQEASRRKIFSKCPLCGKEGNFRLDNHIRDTKLHEDVPTDIRKGILVLSKIPGSVILFKNKYF